MRKSEYDRQKEFMTAAKWDPARWDQMSVSDFLMNAATHLGMDYSKGWSQRWTQGSNDRAYMLSIATGIPDGDLTAAKICDYLAWFHNWIRPEYFPAWHAFATDRKASSDLHHDIATLLDEGKE